MQFEDLRLIEPLLQAIRAKGYDTPTPIQEQAIPHLLEGRDMFGCAQTGTGKTAAFALPILQKLHRNVTGSKSNPKGKGGRGKPPRPIRAMILTPTRELAAQVEENFRAYGSQTGLRHTVIFGGVRQIHQERALQKGVDVLVATPGRLLDLMGQGIIRLSDVEVFVLDEADRMLDMGFIHDIRKVVQKLPTQRQTLMFSATMPREIRKLADTILRDPITVKTTPEEVTAAETVAQSLYFVDHTAKSKLLEKHLKEPQVKRALVFTRTKHRANKVTKHLLRSEISAEAFHSNKSQNARQRALESFKRGSVSVLVASDIAARGIDVENISHVFNYDLPNEAETYVHRIGRTGRAGATGEAISFCSDDEHKALYDIERLLGGPIPVQGDSPRPAAMDRKPKHSTTQKMHRRNENDAPPRKKNASTEGAKTNKPFRGRKRRSQDTAGARGKQTRRRKGQVR